MARVKNKVLTTLLLALSPLWLCAKDVPPRPNRLVSDYASTLSPAEVQQLESKLSAYDKETSTQIAVVILESIEGDDLFDFSQRLAESWGIGGKANDNGVLLLIAMQEREIRIHTGYGAEGALPDALAKRIIENEAKPAFRAGDYFGGIDAATNAIMAALKGEYKAAPKEQENGIPSWAILLMILLLFVFGVLSRKIGYTTYDHKGRHYRSPWLGGMGGFGGGRSGSFGGGFGGFGGGSFGGGGASGRW